MSRLHALWREHAWLAGAVLALAASLALPALIDEPDSAYERRVRAAQQHAQRVCRNAKDPMPCYAQSLQQSRITTTNTNRSAP